MGETAKKPEPVTPAADGAWTIGGTFADADDSDSAIDELTEVGFAADRLTIVTMGAGVGDSPPAPEGTIMLLVRATGPVEAEASEVVFDRCGAGRVRFID